MVEKEGSIVFYWINQANAINMKKLILILLAFTTSVYSAGMPTNEQSKWKKVKEVLVSRPAKIIYSCVAILLVGRQIGKGVLKREAAERLRNGKIVLSWFENKENDEIRNRLDERYNLPNPSYRTNCSLEAHNEGKLIIVQEPGVSKKNYTLNRIYRDVKDMNTYSASIDKPTNWKISMEQIKRPEVALGLPLSENFDVPLYQVRIAIPE